MEYIPQLHHYFGTRPPKNFWGIIYNFNTIDISEISKYSFILFLFVINNSIDLFLILKKNF